MTLGIDFAWTKPDPAAVKQAGYSFVVGYISRDPTKDLNREQALAYQQLGLGALLVWEWTSGRALAGAQAGIADAKEAVGKARARGYPDDVPILFADDTDTTADQVRPYFAAVSSVRPCSGAYGPYKVVDPLLADGTIRYGWQACAWASHDPSGRELISTRAHLYQRLKPTTTLAGSYDEDVLLRPLPMWTIPTQKGYAMLVFAQGLDATTALAVCAARRAGAATTDVNEAKAAIARGDKVIVIGGPAATALGLQAPVGHPTSVGGALVAIGQTASDTLALACQVIA